MRWLTLLLCSTALAADDAPTITLVPAPPPTPVQGQPLDPERTQALRDVLTQPEPLHAAVQAGTQPLRVLSVQRVTDTIQVAFSQPMRPGDPATPVTDTLDLALDPPLTGVWSWANEDTAQFVPHQPLATDTPYTLTIGEQTTAVSGQTLQQSSAYTLHKPLQIQLIDTVDCGAKECVRILFNGPVDAQELLPRLRATAWNGRDVALRAVDSETHALIAAHPLSDARWYDPTHQRHPPLKNANAPLPADHLLVLAHGKGRRGLSSEECVQTASSPRAAKQEQRCSRRPHGLQVTLQEADRELEYLLPPFGTFHPYRPEYFGEIIGNPNKYIPPPHIGRTWASSIALHSTSRALNMPRTFSIWTKRPWVVRATVYKVTPDDFTAFQQLQHRPGTSPPGVPVSTTRVRLRPSSRYGERYKGEIDLSDAVPPGEPGHALVTIQSVAPRLRKPPVSLDSTCYKYLKFPRPAALVCWQQFTGLRWIANPLAIDWDWTADVGTGLKAGTAFSLDSLAMVATPNPESPVPNATVRLMGPSGSTQLTTTQDGLVVRSEGLPPDTTTAIITSDNDTLIVDRALVPHRSNVSPPAKMEDIRTMTSRSHYRVGSVVTLQGLARFHHPDLRSGAETLSYHVLGLDISGHTRVDEHGVFTLTFQIPEQFDPSEASCDRGQDHTTDDPKGWAGRGMEGRTRTEPRMDRRFRRSHSGREYSSFQTCIQFTALHTQHAAYPIPIDHNHNVWITSDPHSPSFEILAPEPHGLQPGTLHPIRIRHLGPNGDPIPNDHNLWEFEVQPHRDHSQFVAGRRFLSGHDESTTGPDDLGRYSEKVYTRTDEYGESTLMLQIPEHLSAELTLKKATYGPSSLRWSPRLFPRGHTNRRMYLRRGPVAGPPGFWSLQDYYSGRPEGVFAVVVDEDDQLLPQQPLRFELIDDQSIVTDQCETLSTLSPLGTTCVLTPTHTGPHEVRVSMEDSDGTRIASSEAIHISERLFELTLQQRSQDAPLPTVSKQEGAPGLETRARDEELEWARAGHCPHLFQPDTLNRPARCTLFSDMLLPDQLLERFYIQLQPVSQPPGRTRQVDLVVRDTDGQAVTDVAVGVLVEHAPLTQVWSNQDNPQPSPLGPSQVVLQEPSLRPDEAGRIRLTLPREPAHSRTILTVTAHNHQGRIGHLAKPLTQDIRLTAPLPSSLAVHGPTELPIRIHNTGQQPHTVDLVLHANQPGFSDGQTTIGRQVHVPAATTVELSIPFSPTELGTLQLQGVVQAGETLSLVDGTIEVSAPQPQQP